MPSIVRWARFNPAMTYNSARERIRTSTPITGTRPSTGCLPLIPRGLPGSCSSTASMASTKFEYLRISCASADPAASPRLPQGERPPRGALAARFVAGDRRLPVLRLRDAA